MSKRSGKEKLYSDHHLLCRHPYWTELEWSNHPNNILRISDIKHRSIHNLFENLMLAEQLITMIDISDKALKPEIRQRLLETLNSKDIHNPREWYKDECII